MRSITDFDLDNHLGVGLDMVGDADGSGVACVLTGHCELDRLGGLDPGGGQGEHSNSREGHLSSKLLPCHCVLEEKVSSK